MFSEMNGALTTSDMKQKKYQIFYAVLVLILLVYLAIVLVPCLWLLVAGFKDVGEMYQATFFPKKIDLGKLAYAWKRYKYYKYYLNTFILAGGCVIADVVVSGLAGYVLSRLKPKGSKIIYVIIFLFMILPATATTVPLYMTFMDFPIFHVSLLDTYLPMWLLASVNMFNIILFKTNFDGVSISLVEAAKIDGANDMQIFLKVMIPLSIPVIMTVSLFTFNAQFGSFFWPFLVLQDREKYTLGVQVYNMKTAEMTMDYQMMGILFSILPQLVIFACFQKHIMGGMNLGGVKG